MLCFYGITSLTSPAVNPITPRAPVTGGVWLVFKLNELPTLSTLVSPGRASSIYF